MKYENYRTKRKRFFHFFLLPSSFFLFLTACGSSTLEVPEPYAEAAWIRLPAPGRDVTAAYLVLHNPARTALRVTAVRSPQFEAAELHETRHEGGMARMRPLPVLEIAAGGSAELRPLGMHLMLYRPLGALAPGDEVTLVFDYERGGVHGALEVVAEVRRP